MKNHGKSMIDLCFTACSIASIEVKQTCPYTAQSIYVGLHVVLHWPKPSSSAPMCTDVIYDRWQLFWNRISPTNIHLSWEHLSSTRSNQFIGCLDAHLKIALGRVFRWVTNKRATVNIILTAARPLHVCIMFTSLRQCGTSRSFSISS